MEEVMTMEFSDEFKKNLIRIIKCSLKGEKLTDSEFIILFNWVRHQTDPAYEFVPMKYRTIKTQTKGGTKNGIQRRSRRSSKKTERSDRTASTITNN